MKKGYFIFLSAILLATSCNSSNKKPKNQSEQNETETSSVEQSSAPNVSSGEVHPTSSGNSSTVVSSSIDSQVSTVSQTSINSQTSSVSQSSIDSQSTTQPIEHHHVWTAASYTWNSDHTECTAERTCIVPPVHTESETVQSNYVVYTQPTCESNGLGLFTAVFTNENFTEQQYLYQIPANGHNFDEPTYEWNEDYSQCTARRVCLTDSNHVETETVSSQIVHIEAPKCETGGVDAFKASFANHGFSDQFHYYDVEQIGHDFGEVSYTWSNDYLKCTAKRVCKNDSSHIEEETVDCDVQVLTALDCEVDGHEIHTASFVNPVFQTQYRDIELTHTGHTFGAPTYTWNEDHSQCTAERVCQNNGSHIERETVDSSSRYIDEPTYINTGVREFTAEFINNAFSKQVFNENVPTLDYLIYEISPYSDFYYVAGIVEDYNGPVTIPSTYNGLPVERIKNNAFRQSTISSITIPSSVTTIGRYAFADCTNLESITLSEGLRCIDEYAFYYCRALKSLDLPSTVQTIGEHAFYYAGLASIVLPSSLVTVGSYAFYNCKSDELVIPSSLINITQYSFRGAEIKNIRIPNNYTKTIVQNIVSYNSYIEAVLIEEDNPYFFTESGVLFEKTTNDIVFVSKNIEGEFVIPSFMTFIPESFLRGCSKITSVVLHDNVESIGSYAFAECSSLTEVHIPDSVTTLGQNIFYKCSSLTIVTLPAGITSIPNGMFSQCSKLQTLSLPNTITSIGESSFSGCRLLDLTLPTSIETLGDYAFSSSGLTIVNLPNLTSIGSYAFSSSKVQSVSLGNTITTIPYGAFRGSAITNIVLPESLLTIQSYAFEWCTSLVEINLPTSLTTIGHYPFLEAGLTSIFIPKNVSSLVALGLNAEATISISNENDYYAAIDNVIYSKDMKTLVYTNKNDTTFEVIEGVTTIAEYAINVDLESISLPSTLVTIEDNAFSGEKLQSITLPESLKTIGYGVFGYNNSIKQLVFPKNFESLGGGNYFVGLESIKLSDSMGGSILNQISYKIPQVEIYDTNPNLEMVSGILYSESLDTIAWASPSLEGEISIPESVKTILQYAFAECTKITKVVIPDNVTNISKYAFAYCSSLKEAILPIQIGFTINLFNGCPLESITLPDNRPLDDICFSSNNEYNEENYLGCCYPKTLKNVIVRDSNTRYTKRGKAIYDSFYRAPSDGDEALIFVERDFDGEFVVPESTTRIGEAAFADCLDLTSVVFGSNVKMIDDYAFYNSVSLESIEMNDGLNELEIRIFVNCKSLTSVVFPNSITDSWGNYLFEDCDSLEYVKIADSMSLYEPDRWSKNLETIELYDTNTKYKSVDDVIYTADLRSLIFIPKSTSTLVLPVEMTYIPSDTIRAHEGPIDLVVTNPNINLGLGGLPDNIRSLTIPDEMNILDSSGKELKFSVSSLDQLIIPETNQYVTMVDDVLYTKDMSTILFVSSNKTGNFVIPDTVKTIASYAFADCTKITSIQFNDGLEMIGSGAFEGCSGLTNVSLPSSLKEMKRGAFKDCTSLVHVTIPDLTIGQIYMATFQNCTSLVEFNVPLGAIGISEGAFTGCSSLATVTFPEVFYGIGYEAFFNCTSLHEIVLPEGTQILNRLAFGGCSSLEEIYIPSSVTNDILIPFLANELVITYGGTYEEWLSHVEYLEIDLSDERYIYEMMEVLGYIPNNDFILHCSDGSYSYNYASNTYTPL